MADYKQTTGEANTWRRCFRVHIDNPLEGAKKAIFWEEDVVTLGTRTIKSEVGPLLLAFDPEATIMLRDPATNELTGAYTTQGNLYVELYSLYMQTAIARDAA